MVPTSGSSVDAAQCCFLICAPSLLTNESFPPVSKSGIVISYCFFLFFI